MSTNPYLANQVAGMDVGLAYTGTNKAKVQQLIDLVSKEDMNVDEARYLLDGMLPETRTHLYGLLVALKTSIVDA